MGHLLPNRGVFPLERLDFQSNLIFPHKQSHMYLLREQRPFDKFPVFQNLKFKIKRKMVRSRFKPAQSVTLAQGLSGCNKSAFNMSVMPLANERWTIDLQAIAQRGVSHGLIWNRGWTLVNPHQYPINGKALNLSLFMQKYLSQRSL